MEIEIAMSTDQKQQAHRTRVATCWDHDNPGRQHSAVGTANLPDLPNVYTRRTGRLALPGSVSRAG